MAGALVVWVERDGGDWRLDRDTGRSCACGALVSGCASMVIE